MPEIIIEAKYPSLPKTPPPVLLLQSPHVSERFVLESARRFRLSGERAKGMIRTDPFTIVYSEGPIDYHVFRDSGGFKYKDRHLWMKGDGVSSLKISDQDAKRSASTAARKFELLRGNVTSDVIVKRLHVASSKSDGKLFTDRITHVAVQFQRSISGTAVDGPGGKMTVYLDPNMNLTGVEVIWRQVERIFKVTKSLITPEEAVQEVRQRLLARGFRSGVIKQIRFAYLELGWRTRQRFMQPAYIVFTVLGESNSSFRHGIIEVVHASTNPVGSLVVPPPHKSMENIKPRIKIRRK